MQKSVQKVDRDEEQNADDGCDQSCWDYVASEYQFKILEGPLRKNKILLSEEKIHDWSYHVWLNLRLEQ